MPIKSIVRARSVALVGAGFATLLIAATLLFGGLADAAGSSKRPGHFRGVVTAANSAGRALHGRLFASPAAAQNMTYHGGPVMHSDANYSIYWEPSGHSTTANYKTVLDTYFRNVAAASGVSSNDYSLATQYSDGSGPIVYRSTFGRRILATNPYPASGCASSSGPCLTDAQLETELGSVIATNKLPTGLGTVYYIFTPSGVATCFDSTGLDCSSGGPNFDYCAYHSSFTSGASTVLYAVMPYAYVSGCNSGESPNHDPADSTINVTSHENIESITDPLGSAWYDSSGAEIGDKCAWNFGSALGGSAGAEYNEQMSTGNYYLQQEWSNASTRCVQRMSSPAGGPTASFVFSPTAPQATRAVSFNASGSSDPYAKITAWWWTFGDGKSGSAKTVSHSYSADGTYTVTLKVTDQSGRTSTASQKVTVSG